MSGTSPTTHLSVQDSTARTRSSGTDGHTLQRSAAVCEADAAAVIQRTYRAHRSRRELAGLGLSASARWAELVRDVQYQHATCPLASSRLLSEHRSSSHQEPDSNLALASEAAAPESEPAARHQRQHPSFAQEEWKRIAQIARHAGHDDFSDDEQIFEGAAAKEIDLEQDKDDKLVKKGPKAKQERQKLAQLMPLQYWLELVDQKHRYGSHLRAYHAVWMRQDTRENFFYWLDYGDGRHVEVPTCSRERLDKDQVRYLTREERQMYRVNIDDGGRLVWAKNGNRVSTSVEYRDSVGGIIPTDDPTPAWRSEDHGQVHHQQRASHSSSTELATADVSSTSDSSMSSDDEGRHYVNNDMSKAHGIQKIHHVSAAALLDHLLQSTTRKNTWIFVADTSFRLYVGIKQSGAFQHSSFLKGARIAAAGLIKIKNGQIRSLSPLSGHYRPPTRNFRAFVHALRDSGADMSRVSISKSYAILLGLEGYVKTKRKVEKGLRKVEVNHERMFHPELAQAREEREQDSSKSAQREREHLEKVYTEERERKKNGGWARRISAVLRPSGKETGSINASQKG